MKYLFIAIVCFIFLNGCGGCGPCPNCGCDNVEDCLSKYKFEEARKYAANNNNSKEMAYIAKSEASYWITNNDLNKATQIAKELFAMNPYRPDGCISLGRDLLSEGDRNIFYIEIINNIINKHCSNGELVKAKNLAIELPEKMVIKIESSHHIESDEKAIYDKIKSSLNNNQEIEPWKSGGCYLIITYSNPREGALKIIEVYKKEK